MFLESLCHESNAFVTLTYDEENADVDGNLCPNDLTLFLKRFRALLSPNKFRYFAVGEYGDNSGRPHFHFCGFGIGRHHEPYIDHAWGKGFVQVGDFTPQSAAYCAGYVVKKMTNPDDWRLDGRHPEYARMSNRPGIGAPAMSVIGNDLLCDFGLDEINNTGDVPIALRTGRKSIPLGRYLRNKLRDEVGVPEAMRDLIKQRWIDEKGSEVLALLQAAINRQEPATAQTVVVADNIQKIRNIEARDKIRRARRSL